MLASLAGILFLFMRIFYGASAGRADVPSKAAAEQPLETTVAIFRSLDARRGFLGIILDDRFCLQLFPERKGICVELLDRSIPALDAAVVDAAFAESLIQAAAAGQNVFGIARASQYKWDHLHMG